MKLKIRIILDAKDDVFRDIIISENENLLTLHESIKQAFNLKGEEMASFYLSNQDWFQGSEIPMVNVFDEDGGETMDKILLKDVVSKEGNRMIYVYDFLNIWTFFCETVEVVDENSNKNKKQKPEVVFSFGEVPAEAPQKESMDVLIDEFDEDLDEDLNNDEDDDEFYLEEDYDKFY